MRPAAPPLSLRDWTVVGLSIFLVWSGIDPFDRLTWALEVCWVVAAIALWVLWLRRLPATAVTFWVVVVHAVILVVGGIYTYAHVPIGLWVQEWMGRPRNDYDRLGHFIQGFAPALIWREVFIRKAIVAGRGWLSVIVVGMCLAFSALFELLEFASALLLGEDSINFLGAQGDVWDAQWDMLFCMVGAAMAVAMLGPMQDRQIARG
jgi:putative membrane protein